VQSTEKNIGHISLIRPILSLSASHWPVRLACVRHAASVRSEPGSNSQNELITGAYFLVFKELPATPGLELLRLFPSGRPGKMFRLSLHRLRFLGLASPHPTLRPPKCYCSLSPL
jgi:hypothetical protein